MGFRKVAKKIVEQGGCFEIECSSCPIGVIGGCEAWQLDTRNNTLDWPNVVAQAKEWLEDHPKKVKEPAWDDQFVPGRFYASIGGDIVLCIGNGWTPTTFMAITVRQVDSSNNVGDMADNYAKVCFKPCKVSIKVEE